MTIPSARQQLDALGYGAVVPTRNGLKVGKPMKRTPIDNTPHRKQVRTEESYYPDFEALLGQHDCDFFHPTTNHLTRRRKGQKGWVDYTVLGLGWHAFVELKARNAETGRAGRLDEEQLRYKASIERANGEHRVFLLPDDWHAIDLWLNRHTGKGIWGSGKVQA